ncbi:MAG: S8 family serine peptidase, partial [Bacteroidota bacterium]|nr:S8 family serine peptidase [Bacteroidota bacterium]
MKKIIISISIICFFISPSFSQQPTHKSGEIIVQLAKDNIIENVIFDYKKFNNKETNIELVKKLSNSLKIWLIKFDSKNINEINLLYSLKENPAIVNAQFNHKLEYRKNTPNDTLYHKQWQYENTGQLSGLPDADIDIDEAWEITTGGVTALGDTIVIAIVDDGFDTLHPDFTGNIWYNKNEIPNNGIDDDNNGYVDDYKGWNTYQGNDDIKNGKWGGEHGTSVTGIVGAKGNNTTGVSGVNWNVKMMIVVGGGYESDAISAYSYLLEMRKIYNQTDGEKGAYIVSSNSSWGVDFGKATDAPLWCAMYDSLGKYGIVNAAATSNMNIDVDVKGDLPSTCPSKYLICVTNTNNTDMKESAGYGVTHVDLGAPG